MANNEWEDLVVNVLRDADSFEDSSGTEVRVSGLNAHEKNNPGGPEATNWAQTVVDNAVLEISPKGERDVYDRQLADVRFKDTGASYSAEAIRRGHAAPYGGSATDEDFLSEQQSVAAKTLGVIPRTVNESFDLDLNSSSGIDQRPGGGTFTNAVARGKDNLDTLVYSAGNAAAMALGDIIGTDTLDEWGEEGLRRNLIDAAMNPAEISSYDDVDDLDSAFTYAIEALGEQVPNMAAMIGTGGLGSVAVRAAVGKKLLQHALKKEMRLIGKETGAAPIANAESRAAANAVAASKTNKLYQNSMMPGVTAASYTMGVGEIHQELKEGGINSPGTALINAVPFALLDTAAFQSHIGRLFKGVDRGIATQSVKDIAGSIIKTGVIGAGAESSTEMMQEIITLASRAYHDPTFEIFSDENMKRIKEAGVKAAVVGGVSGGGVTTAQSLYAKATAPPKDPPPPPPVAEEPDDTFTPPKRERNYEFIPKEVTVPATEVFDDESAVGQDLNLKATLEETIDPEIDTVEQQLTAYEALMRCINGK